MHIHCTYTVSQAKYFNLSYKKLLSMEQNVHIKIHVCVYILHCMFIFLHMQLIPSWKWHVKEGQWSVSGFHLGSMGGECLPPLEIPFAPLSIVNNPSPPFL